MFADFRRTGRPTSSSPTARASGIFLDDLRDADVRARLRGIWTDPLASIRRGMPRASRARSPRAWPQVSKALEARGQPPEDVAHFLMRCLFTMFAEDVGLLPEDSFSGLLADCVDDPGDFVPMLRQLCGRRWSAGGVQPAPSSAQRAPLQRRPF